MGMMKLSLTKIVQNRSTIIPVWINEKRENNLLVYRWMSTRIYGTMWLIKIGNINQIWSMILLPCYAFTFYAPNHTWLPLIQ